MEITNVGIAGDTLQRVGSIIEGRATIYSTEANEEFEDDFSFAYNVDADDLKTSVAVLFLGGEYFNTIREMLIDNLRTNFI